mmetsp:Transcript_63291/g.137693  ORF Transcript_63291/g.137693 Transcript_63291/m.137693 type:complete len:247 (+) Transcript_63291:39-779(+)
MLSRKGDQASRRRQPHGSSGAYLTTQRSSEFAKQAFSPEVLAAAAADIEKPTRLCDLQHEKKNTQAQKDSTQVAPAALHPGRGICLWAPRQVLFHPPKSTLLLGPRQRDEFCPEMLVGKWEDSLGHDVSVSLDDAFELHLVALLSRPSQRDIHLSMRRTVSGGWLCGNASLDVGHSSSQVLHWDTDDGRHSTWWRATFASKRLAATAKNAKGQGLRSARAARAEAASGNVSNTVYVRTPALEQQFQ